MKIKRNIFTVIPDTNEEDVDLQDADEEDEEQMEEESKRHSELVESISKLNKRSKKERRTEASSKVSIDDLNAVRGNDSKLKIHELVKIAKDSSGSLQKQFRKISRKRLLKVPLVTPIADKLTRQTNYTVVSKEVSKWKPIVEANRNAEQLQFPLNEPILHYESTYDFVRFKPTTELEKEVHQLLGSSSNNLTSDRLMTEAEEKYLKAMSLEEAKARHKELQKMRALLSYQEAKMKRQKRIKSKTFHRLLKKDKLKKEMKEFEELKIRNPELAVKKLEELDKIRALERASLRHKNTGKWAKHKLLSAKNNKDARDALAHQVELNKQLTQKRVTFEDKDDMKWSDTPLLSEAEMNANEENKTENNEVEKIEFVESNPWLQNAKNVLKSCSSGNGNETTTEGAAQDEGELALNPKKFLTMKTAKLNSALPIFDENGVNASDLLSENEEEEEQHKLIKEAFAEDDVVDDFTEEKRDTMEKEKLKDVNLYLPGWGNWGGAGVVESKKKKQRFIRKAPKSKRKDSNLGNVIISEKKDDIISKYMIKNLPFPFTNVVEFEKSIKHPIGHNWNTEISHRKMVEPNVVTKMGKIIEPMDKETLLDYMRAKEQKELKLEDIITLK